MTKTNKDSVLTGYLRRDIMECVERMQTQYPISNQDEAIQLWEDLVQGRWSVTTRFNTNGWRCLVAAKNDSAHAGSRELAFRKRQVAEHIT